MAPAKVSDFLGLYLMDLWQEFKVLLIGLVPIIVALLVLWRGQVNERYKRKEAVADALAIVTREQADKRESEKKALDDALRVVAIEQAKKKEKEEIDAAATLRTWYNNWHDELRKEVHDWRQQVQKLTNELDLLRRDRRDADKEMTEQRVRHDQEIGELRQQVAAKEKELATSRQRITELEQQVNELKRVNIQENRGNGS